MAELSLLIRAVLFGGLTAALALEPSPATESTAPQGLAPAALSGPAPAAPTAMPADQVKKAVSTVLARPLFRADRRPPRLPSEPAAVADRAEELPRLSGIVVSAAGGTAIFEGGSKPIIARVGDRLGAFTVAAITVAGVTVDGPQGAEVIVPSFDKTAARPDAAAITQPAQPLVNDAIARLPLPPNLNEMMNRRRVLHGQQAR